MVCNFMFCKTKNVREKLYQINILMISTLVMEMSYYMGDSLLFITKVYKAVWQPQKIRNVLSIILEFLICIFKMLIGPAYVRNHGQNK